jgi:hypothetical protein
MSNFILKTLETRELKLNTIRLRGFYGGKLRKGSGGGGSGEGFPQLPGDVTRWHFGGLTNEMMAAMDDPRIEDADHKGRFLSFKNFAWGGMSGVGGYSDNFSSDSWKKPSDRSDITWTSSSFNITRVMNTGVQIYYFSTWEESESVIPEKRIIVKGLEDGQVLRYMNVGNRIIEISQDGIYTIPSFTFKGANSYHGYSLAKKQESCNVTVEQLPLYPGALVFDGVDDCGVCDNFPILTKEKGYTVVALRSYLAESIGYLVYNGTNAKQSAFAFERSDSLDTWSWGKNSSIRNLLPKLMSYQTSNSYNNNIISTGTAIEGDKLIRIASSGGYCNVAIWELVFLDHDATEEELTKIKDYFVKTYPWLFPDQAWTVTGKTNEDEDRATIANITGNGNDLVLSNFGFAEGSGYGLYGQNYISYAITNRAVYTKTNSSIHVTKSITAGVNFTESARDVTIPSYRIKVTGIQSGQEMIYRGSNNTFLTNIPSDGIYVLPAVENGSNLGFQFISYTGDCDITIEQIPEYEGYLVTDGVDDKIVSAESIAFTDTWTIITDAIFLGEKVVSAGILVKDIFGVSNLMEYGRVEVSVKGGVLLKVPTPSIKAICSDGRIYDADWNEYQAEPGTIKVSEGKLYIGMWYNGMQFCSIAFKNLAIYPTVLSKEDCIKAYNYLQTLKAK